MPRKIIIDTDPGVDDAMAILFALRCPELEVMGLTTVFGNVEVDLATENALRILEFDGRGDIPVAHGAGKPLKGEFGGPADFVHGRDGLGNVNLPRPSGAAHEKAAAQFMVDAIMTHPGEVTLVPIGPLTNIAHALDLQPAIAEKVSEVVLMGGAVNVNGNINPAAEANIFNDPHAADRVFTARWPKLTMIGLDVTTQVLADGVFLQSLQETEAGKFIYEISRFYEDFHVQAHAIEALHTHDPSAIAYLVDPTIFETTLGSVRVVTEGLALGQTILNRERDWLFANAWTDLPEANVCVGVDGDRLLALFRSRILS